MTAHDRVRDRMRNRNRLVAAAAIAVVAVVLVINIVHAAMLARDWWSRPRAVVEHVDAVDGRAHVVRIDDDEPSIDANTQHSPYVRGRIVPSSEALGKTLANATMGTASGDRLACIDRGWFTTRSERERAKERLEALGAETREYEAALTGADHVVFVRPAASASLARQTRADLATQSIPGFVKMTPPRRFAVVVGISASREEATVLRDAVANLGYDTAIESLDRGATVFGLLAYRVPKAHAASVPHRACPGVATQPWFL